MKKGGPLKRSGPLKRKTPLRYDQTAKLARTPLNTTSKKRVAENVERRKAKEVVLFRSNGRCEISPLLAAVGNEAARKCTIYGRDFHEILTRARGGSISDPENILFACGPCHRYVTDYTTEAEVAGAVRSQYVNADLQELQNLQTSDDAPWGRWPNGEPVHYGTHDGSPTGIPNTNCGGAPRGPRGVTGEEPNGE